MTEREIVLAFNSFLKDDGFCQRLKQSRFAYQYVDLIVDSAKYGYLFVEHKSMKYKKGKKLYFSSNFDVDKNGVHQVKRITKYMRQTGRKGFLFIELRRGTGRKRLYFAIPWKQVNKWYKSDVKGIDMRMMKRKGLRISSDKGTLNIKHLLFKS